MLEMDNSELNTIFFFVIWFIFFIFWSIFKGFFEFFWSFWVAFYKKIVLLLLMLESEAQLRQKVDEAMRVLNQKA